MSEQEPAMVFKIDDYRLKQLLCPLCNTKTPDNRGHETKPFSCGREIGFTEAEHIAFNRGLMWASEYYYTQRKLRGEEL
jgi:hypothetical protein